MSKRELKWPWKEFPKDEMSWEVCKSQMEQAVEKLGSCLFFGTFNKNVPGLTEGILELLDQVLELYVCTDTIPIKEFKNLLSRAEAVGGFGGRFALTTESHKKQCENLKVGDTVFFLDATYAGLSEDNTPQVDVFIRQAVVE